MLNNLRGVLPFLFFCFNTVFWCLPIFALAAVKVLVPGARRLASRPMARLGENWILCNNLNLALTQNVKWDIQGVEGFSLDRSYLVCANHQSWVDIVALHKALNHRIPFMRFFLKSQLIWVPFLGAAWWALDFPFMKRHSREHLRKHPEKRGDDLETTRRACEKFRGTPISILNFLEGTRFTAAKHRSQASVYKNLLAPKTGGIAFVLEAMGDQFDSLIDVTIYYPGGPKTIWGLFCGRVREVVVRAEKHDIPRDLLGGAYHDDGEYRLRLQAWLRGIWERKDRTIDQLRATHG